MSLTTPFWFKNWLILRGGERGIWFGSGGNWICMDINPWAFNIRDGHDVSCVWCVCAGLCNMYKGVSRIFFHRLQISFFRDFFFCPWRITDTMGKRGQNNFFHIISSSIRGICPLCLTPLNVYVFYLYFLFFRSYPLQIG